MCFHSFFGKVELKRRSKLASNCHFFGFKSITADFVHSNQFDSWMMHAKYHVRKREIG